MGGEPRSDVVVDQPPELGWRLIKSSMLSVTNSSQHGGYSSAWGLFAGVGSEAPNVCLPEASTNRRLGGPAQLPEQFAGWGPRCLPCLTFAGGREKGDTGRGGRLVFQGKGWGQVGQSGCGNC